MLAATSKIATKVHANRFWLHEAVNVDALTAVGLMVDAMPGVQALLDSLRVGRLLWACLSWTQQLNTFLEKWDSGKILGHYTTPNGAFGMLTMAIASVSILNFCLGGVIFAAVAAGIGLSVKVVTVLWIASTNVIRNLGRKKFDPEYTQTWSTIFCWIKQRMKNCMKGASMIWKSSANGGNNLKAESSLVQGSQGAYNTPVQSAAPNKVNASCSRRMLEVEELTDALRLETLATIKRFKQASRRVPEHQKQDFTIPDDQIEFLEGVLWGPMQNTDTYQEAWAIEMLKEGTQEAQWEREAEDMAKSLGSTPDFKEMANLVQETNDFYATYDASGCECMWE